MKKSVIVPNYERMRESFCYALQTTWGDYCKAHTEYMKSMWFNEHGKLCTMHTDKRKEELDVAEKAFNKAYKDLQDFDEWVNTEKQWDIFREKLFGEETNDGI